MQLDDYALEYFILRTRSICIAFHKGYDEKFYRRNVCTDDAFFHLFNANGNALKDFTKICVSYMHTSQFDVTTDLQTMNLLRMHSVFVGAYLRTVDKYEKLVVSGDKFQIE